MGSDFLSALVITLREGVEGAVALAIVLLYLKKTGRQRLASSVWWGLGVALVASIAGAVVLQRVAMNSEIFEGILMFAAAIFVATMVIWMWRSAKGLRKEIENRLDQITATDGRSHNGIWITTFVFTFLLIFREGIETVIFMSAVNLSTSALISFLGGVTGLFLAVLFGIFLVRGSVRIDLGRFFRITGIVLLMFVLQLVIGGVHELSEGGVIDIGPRGMSIIGPIVKNNALFMLGLALIPVLMLLVPRQQRAAAAESAAERRLRLHQQQKQQMWRRGAAILSIAVVLFISYGIVYGQSRKLSPPVPLHASNGEFRIPLAQVSDGHLHRFIDPSSSIRFIVLREAAGPVAAFDACRICGSQGYVEEAGALICLNCAADINAATITEGGGCNPIPLPSQIDGDYLVVQLQDLRKESGIFSSGGHSH